MVKTIHLYKHRAKKKSKNDFEKHNQFDKQCSFLKNYGKCEKRDIKVALNKELWYQNETVIQQTFFWKFISNRNENKTNQNKTNKQTKQVIMIIWSKNM